MLDLALFYKIGWMRRMTLNEHLTSYGLSVTENFREVS